VYISKYALRSIYTIYPESKDNIKIFIIIVNSLLFFLGLDSLLRLYFCVTLIEKIFLVITLMKKLLLAIIFGITLCMPFYSYSATSTEFSYTTPRTIDTGTFNEYRYKITEQFFTLRSKWEVDGELHKKTLESIGSLAANGYKYLPDNLKNKNYLRKLLTDLQKGTKQPNNDANYTQIIKSISDFIDKVDIQAIK